MPLNCVEQFVARFNSITENMAQFKQVIENMEQLRYLYIVSHGSWHNSNFLSLVAHVSSINKKIQFKIKQNSYNKKKKRDQ